MRHESTRKQRRGSRSRSGQRSQTPAPPTKSPQSLAAPAPVPDWLADLFPGTGPSAGASQIALVRPQVAATPMEIPLALAPLLTSNGNAALNRICAASGAEIAIRQDMQHLGYALAIITGTGQATTLARGMVMQQIGLAGGGNITKEVEVSGDPRLAIGAVDVALAELRTKASRVHISYVPARALGEKGRVSIGPGPVAHVAAAETLVRKKIVDAELDLCYRQGRPVPAELKVPVPCKFFDAGECSLGGRCQYAHGSDELQVAKRMSRPVGSQEVVQRNVKRISDVNLSSQTSQTSALL